MRKKKNYATYPNYVVDWNNPDVANQGNENAKNGSNSGIWNSLIEGAGGILSGIGSIIGASKGTLPDNNYYTTDNSRNNTSLYITIGVITLIVVVILVFAFRGKK